MNRTQEFAGTTYLNKNEALQVIEIMRKNRRPIHSIEVVSIEDGTLKTSMNKTLWFQKQTGVYARSRQFVMRQMVGEWNLVEIK